MATKTRLVAKLRSGRQRKRMETGKKVGGCESHSEQWLDAVARWAGAAIGGLTLFGTGWVQIGGLAE